MECLYKLRVSVYLHESASAFSSSSPYVQVNQDCPEAAEDSRLGTES